MMAAAAAAGQGQSHGRVDMDDLMNDPDLEKLHRDRLMEMQRDAEKRQVMQRKGHGEYQVLPFMFIGFGVWGRSGGRGTQISCRAPGFTLLGRVNPALQGA